MRTHARMHQSLCGGACHRPRSAACLLSAAGPSCMCLRVQQRRGYTKGETRNADDSKKQIKSTSFRRHPWEGTSLCWVT